MGSVTCNQCGFVSFATSEVCKQCGNPLVAGHPGGQGWQPPGAGFVGGGGAELGGGRSKGMAASALVCGLAGVPAMIGVLLLGALLGGDMMACAMLGFAVFGVSSLLGIGLGITATVRANRHPADFGGKGLAVAGIVLGALALVCVVPVGVVAAIAVPNLMAARRATNEGMALGAIRDIVTAQQDYAELNEGGEYGTLDELGAARLIDERLSGGVKSGYRFEIETTGDSYVVAAVPVDYPNSGARSFYFASSEGIIHAGDNRGGPADENDPVVFNGKDKRELPLTEEEAEALESLGRRGLGAPR